MLLTVFLPFLASPLLRTWPAAPPNLELCLAALVLLPPVPECTLSAYDFVCPLHRSYSKQNNAPTKDVHILNPGTMNCCYMAKGIMIADQIKIAY